MHGFKDARFQECMESLMQECIMNACMHAMHDGMDA